MEEGRRQPENAHDGEAGGELPPTEERRSPYPAIGIAIIGVLVLTLYAPVLVWMVNTWQRDAYYSHAFLIPPLAAFLVWTKRERLAQIPLDGQFRGLGLILGALLLYALGVWGDVNFLSAISLISVLGGLLLWIWGRQATRELLFPLAFLLFMVPLGKLLSDAFSNSLQRKATEGAVAALRIFGIPADMLGARIDVPQYTFIVAEACSGLKSIIAMTALAALLAYLVKAPPWKRLVVFAAAVPAAVAANIVRITVVVLVGQCFGAEAAEGFFHGASGVIVFVVGFAALMGTARLLGCREMRDEL